MATTATRAYIQDVISLVYPGIRAEVHERKRDEIQTRLRADGCAGHRPADPGDRHCGRDRSGWRHRRRLHAPEHHRADAQPVRPRRQGEVPVHVRPWLKQLSGGGSVHPDDGQQLRRPGFPGPLPGDVGRQPQPDELLPLGHRHHLPRADGRRRRGHRFELCLHLRHLLRRGRRWPDHLPPQRLEPGPDDRGDHRRPGGSDHGRGHAHARRVPPAAGLPESLQSEHHPGLPDRRRSRSARAAADPGPARARAAHARRRQPDRFAGARGGMGRSRCGRPHPGQRQLPRRTHDRRTEPVPVHHLVEVGGRMPATGSAAARAIGAIAIMILLAATSRPAGAAAAAERDLGPAPDFTLETVAGDRTTLGEALAHGPVILDFWATWCGPCRQALPALQVLHERYASRGLSVLAVSVDEPRNRPKIGATARALGLTIPVLIDTEKRASQLYRVEAVPMTFLIDREGRIRSLHRGYRQGDAELLEQELLPLLDPEAGNAE
ncbi:MAG: hypothetical protein C0395_01780 [Gemmatimonas sp.]|nr:hypothetical protein [Gemmatimonas sp.]